MLTGLGNGLLLPALLTWALTPLTYEQRGRGTGLWTSASFLGNFASPIVVIALGAAFGGLGPAIAAIGALSLVVGVAVRLGLRVRIAWQRMENASRSSGTATSSPRAGGRRTPPSASTCSTR